MVRRGHHLEERPEGAVELAAGKSGADLHLSIVNAEGGWNEFKSFRDTFDFFGAKNPLVKDQLGFWPMESFIYNVFSNNSPDVDLSGEVLPGSREAGPITYFSGNASVVPKGSKNKADTCVRT